MIPVLHPADSTSWATFGVGALTDAISCEVMEERNGQYELEMTYPVSGQHYSSIELRSIILAKPNYTDNPQPFRVYKISKPLNGIVTINAQHISYDLSGYIDGVFSAVGVQASLIALKANCTPASCPFTFSSDMSESTGTLEVLKPTSIRALMGGTSGSLIDHWHGEWSYDGYACRFDANRGTDRGVTIRYGKNLTSIKQEENNASVYTGIYPYWFNPDTKEIVTLPEKTIAASGTYSYTKICPVDLSDKFEEAPTAAQLRAAAQAYISSHDIGIPEINLQLGFVQLDEIKERVDLCDTVHVYFDEMGVSASAKCVRTRWNVLSEQYIKIELGSIRASIASTIAGIRETAEQAHTATSTLADTARTISEKITGQMGGYVVVNDTDNDGEPDEILIMDSPDKETAVNVIRMNNAGIAFSQDGYHGTYGTAWSIDGQFVADYITSGVLQANLIRILGTTNFYWDAGNIYIINPQDSGQQIRIGQYDGTRYGIGFTRDGGITWQTAMDFQGLNVSATGFSKTYISLTPPDPADYGLDTFNIGDVWVESDRRYSWDEVGEHTWAWAAQNTWQQLGGATEPNMYTWNGGSWQKIYDGESFTSFETRLTVAEQEIDMAVASVASKGTTYIRLTDPRNDSSIVVNTGDHWIKADPGYNIVTWNRAATMTWAELAATHDWNSMEGPQEFAWDGYDWILVSDHGAEVRHATAIIETDKEVRVMATEMATMNDQVVENTAQLMVQANAIEAEVSQRKSGELTLSSRITQNATAITTEVSRAQASENTLSSRITQNATAITTEVSRAQASENTLSSRITQNANAITAEVTRASNAESAIRSDYIAKSYVTISDDKIELSSLKFNSLGSSGSGIYITPTTIKVSTDGTFELTSTYFRVATDGKIVSTYGSIGGWDINSASIQKLSAVTSGTASTQYGAFLNSPTSISSTTKAIAVGTRAYNGSSYGAWTYPFYVDYAGHLTATSATIQGDITVDSITFSSGVTLSAANLTDGTITTSKLGNGSVTYSKGSSGVKTSLDNGDAAKAAYDSLVAGSITASYLKASNLYGRNLFVGYSGGYRSASWKTISISGTNYTLLGY